MQPRLTFGEELAAKTEKAARGGPSFTPFEPLDRAAVVDEGNVG